MTDDMTKGNEYISLVREPVDLCLACYWYYPVLIGPGERFRRYAPGLRERGVDLRVFTIQYPGLSPSELIDQVPVKRVQLGANARWKEIAFLLKLSWEMYRNKSKPEILQWLSPTLWNLPFVWIFRLFGVPSYFIFALLGNEESGSWLKKSIRKLYWNLLFNPYNCIVTSSQIMADVLLSMGVSPGRIEIIPNGVDLNRFRPAKSPEEFHALRRQFGIEPGDEVIVFIGGIVPRKGVDVLLEAWRRVISRRPRARLFLVGSRHEDEVKHREFNEALDQLIAGTSRPERVIFTGIVPNVEEYLRAADVFVFPSHREGMPNVVPEAMATGLACILTPFRGLPTDFGRPGEDFHLVDRSPDALARAILDLLEDPIKREQLGKNARSWMVQHMNVEKSLDRFADLYKRYAGNRHKEVN